mgnify:FL=1
MKEANHEEIKTAVLSYIQNLFEEMEKEIAMSHQEKYALLEDAFENAGDLGELRIAFERWYADHADDVNFEQDVDELWEQAIGQTEE